MNPDHPAAGRHRGGRPARNSARTIQTNTRDHENSQQPTQNNLELPPSCQGSTAKECQGQQRSKRREGSKTAGPQLALDETRVSPSVSHQRLSTGRSRTPASSHHNTDRTVLASIPTYQGPLFLGNPITREGDNKA